MNPDEDLEAVQDDELPAAPVSADSAAGRAGDVDAAPLQSVSVSGPSIATAVGEIDLLRAEVERLTTRDADNTATITRLASERDGLRASLQAIHAEAGKAVDGDLPAPRRRGGDKPNMGGLASLLMGALAKSQRGA